MADINKCDIEGETRTAYRLKEGAIWEDVKKVYDDTGKYSFGDEFEPFELPVLELKEDILKVGDYNVTVTKEYYGRYWSIYLRQSKEDIMYQVCLGEMCILKSIEDFNNKAAMLFGFYLKDPEGAENGRKCQDMDITDKSVIKWQRLQIKNLEDEILRLKTDLNGLQLVLQESIKEYMDEIVSKTDTINELKNTIERQEILIEKLRCCENCNGFKECIVKCNVDEECINNNKSKWTLE